MFFLLSPVFKLLSDYGIYMVIVLGLLHFTGIYPIDVFFTELLGLIMGLVGSVVDMIMDAIIDAVNPF